MPQSAPDFTTAIITISFLLVLAGIAFVIKNKSGSIKKIIKKQENLEVLQHMPLRSGYLAFIFKVGDENFFFVGHKSGRGSLTQVLQNTTPEKEINNININNPLNDKKQINKTQLFKNETSEKKPLQHVNISDLLTAHKKGGTDA
jgi:hypothetical protein